MKAPRIKYFQRLAAPILRKRDGEYMTHDLHIMATTDEAQSLSQYFEQLVTENPDAPTLSFVRALLLQAADLAVNAETLLTLLTEWKVKAILSEKLSQSDADKAMALLQAHKAGKRAPIRQQHTSTTARRVYVPDPPKPKRIISGGDY